MRKNKKRRRRQDEMRLKKKAERILRNSWGYREKDITKKNIGKTASTHGKPCSCSFCGNPRKFFKERTIQEEKNLLGLSEELH